MPGIDEFWFITVPPSFCRYYRYRKGHGKPRCANTANKGNAIGSKGGAPCNFEECPFAYKSRAQFGRVMRK